MLALLLGGWSTARALWWENPFAATGGPTVSAPLAELSPRSETIAMPMLATVALDTLPQSTPAAADRHRKRARVAPRASLSPQRQAIKARAALAPGASSVWLGALAPNVGQTATSASPDVGAPFYSAPRGVTTNRDRWSVDGWAFWRQGSDAAPISQGRVPIYGASQIGAVLQYRLAPTTATDPRLYARAYRALVANGESEAALGLSLRPVPRLPVRVSGEVRYTDGAFVTALRPALWGVTEITPIAMGLGTRAEIYGQVGWVGGPGATAFADGQASGTREVRAVAAATGERARLSIGVGLWGGAQVDAQRIDVGPTARLDLVIGRVPARLSVDWRERVAGDAAPGSGIAATLATGF